MITKRFGLLATLLFLTPLLTEASTPRGYKTVPTGYNLFEIIYGYTEGDKETDSPLPGSMLSIDRHTTILRYVRYFDWNGRFSGFAFLLPVVDQELTFSNPSPFVPTTVIGDQSGIGDPTFVIASNIFGQPAMDLQEYIAHYKSGKPVHESSMNWSLWITAPTGKYEPTSLVNAGENRWTIKPEINFTHIADKVWFEANAAVSFFTDNTEYLGTGRLERDPLLTLEGHVSVDVPIKLTSTVTMPAWASLSLYGYIGGETSINGVSGDDAANDWALSTNLYLRVHKQYAFRLFYTKTIKHEPTSFDTDTAGFRLTYIF
ncbi:MAG: transporter [Chromatiales bacterium]